MAYQNEDQLPKGRSEIHIRNVTINGGANGVNYQTGLYTFYQAIKSIVDSLPTNTWYGIKTIAGHSVDQTSIYKKGSSTPNMGFLIEWADCNISQNGLYHYFWKIRSTLADCQFIVYSTPINGTGQVGSAQHNNDTFVNAGTSGTWQIVYEVFYPIQDN